MKFTTCFFDVCQLALVMYAEAELGFSETLKLAVWTKPGV
jgi:hypothetical protein